MTLIEYRRLRGKSLEELALDLGLKAGSKGHLSRLENGLVPFPLKLALQVQRVSDGLVPAHTLVSPEDRALLEEARRLPASATEGAAA